MADSSFKHVFASMKIKDIMQTNVVTVREDDDVSEAQEKLTDHHISHLLVIDNDKKFVGLVSQKYLYKMQSPRKIVKEEMDYDPNILIDGDSFYTKETLNSYILRNIMNRHVFTLTKDNSVLDALTYMDKNRVSCIPIVDKNKTIQGVLTDRDLIHYIAAVINS
jgi:acetoin utilization protein AcuB